MSNVRIGFSPTFTAGIYFDTGVIMNTYSVRSTDDYKVNEYY